jgi:putative spermidine/putrescine transport system ATP-binding protein
MAYIEFSDVSKSYDGVIKVVGNLNLSVDKGEFVTFLGPSGSGKTTTLMMLAGFEAPDAGKISLAGKDITDVRSWKRNIGVVFQNYALFPHMTVRSNVGFPLRMRKVPRRIINEKTDRVLDLVGLGAFADRYPNQLSGGQQQRVALARGLVFEPDVLLLDEPLGALDKSLREQMQVELTRIHRTLGMTMIYVTHDQSEAMTMSDRVAVFRAGGVEQFGRPIDLYDTPKNRFVAQFIGDSNLLDVDQVDKDARSVTVAGMGRLAVDRFNACEASQPRTLLVRPEDISILTGDSIVADKNMNVFDLKIEAVVQYGNDSLLLGKIGDGAPLRVRVVAKAGRNLSPSGTVRVGWPSSAGYVV